VNTPAVCLNMAVVKEETVGKEQLTQAKVLNVFAPIV
jgi:hypothetical protein